MMLSSEVASPNSIDIAFFGSSLVSAYWNGAATYYRGVLKALAARGHRTTFYEPDAYDRQAHRDINDPPWARVVVYPAGDERFVRRALRDARGADLVVKASGVGVHDELLEREALELQSSKTLVAFWDVDAPATIARLRRNPRDPLRGHLRQYDVVFTYGGGPPVVGAYYELGARRCEPVYNAVDPSTHFPVSAGSRFECDLALLANRLPDREARADEFFFRVAEALPTHRFVLAGAGWADRSMPPNVEYVGHLYTRDHNEFNCSARAILNVSRQSMADCGFSPATRVFEAAGAGACIITDEWDGVEAFLTPDREVLVARNGDEVARILSDLSPARARAIGQAAHERVLTDHTYDQRAEQVEAVLMFLGSSVIVH